jgi:hypothetical protein
MDWKCGWNGRAPALQAESPKFKPYSHQQKNTKLYFENIDGAFLLKRKTI